MKALTKTLPTKIFDLDIPAPSIQDTEWAEIVKNMSSKKLGPILAQEADENNIWRIMYLINIPKSDSFLNHKGTTRDAEKLAMHRAITSNSLDIVKIFAHYKFKNYDRDDICRMIRDNEGYDAFKFLITQAGYTDIPKMYFSGYTREQALSCAVYSRNLDMVKLIIENGANLSRYSHILDLAKETNLPKIYKYLEQQIDEHNAQFEDIIGEKNNVKTLEKPISEAGTTWEKISDQIIAEHHKLENGQSSLSYIFNFELRQMTSVYKIPPAMAALNTQNFKDIEGIETKIDSAFNCLVKKGGHPNRYETTLVKKSKNVQAVRIDNSKN